MVYSRPPTHRIADGGESADVQLYCVRHYVLTMARFYDTHYRVTCRESVSLHFSDFGEIAPF